jgi:hypothetical protein
VKDPAQEPKQEREPGWYWVRWETAEVIPAQFRYSSPLVAYQGHRMEWWNWAGYWTTDQPSWIGPRIEEPKA